MYGNQYQAPYQPQSPYQSSYPPFHQSPYQVYQANRNPNYGYQQLNTDQQTHPQAQFVKCRIVTSYDEVKATPVDLDGSLNVFTDLGNQAIYTKQINLNGTATINIYRLDTASPESKPQTSTDYVQRSELATLINPLWVELDGLRSKLIAKEEVSHESVQSNANDGNVGANGSGKKSGANGK